MPAHLVSEGKVREDGQVLGPLDRHEEQAGRGLVHTLWTAGGVQRGVVVRRVSLRLIAGHIDVFIHWGKHVQYVKTQIKITVSSK